MPHELELTVAIADEEGYGQLAGAAGRGLISSVAQLESVTAQVSRFYDRDNALRKKKAVMWLSKELVVPGDMFDPWILFSWILDFHAEEDVKINLMCKQAIAGVKDTRGFKSDGEWPLVVTRDFWDASQEALRLDPHTLHQMGLSGEVHGILMCMPELLLVGEFKTQRFLFTRPEEIIALDKTCKGEQTSYGLTIKTGNRNAADFWSHFLGQCGTIRWSWEKTRPNS